MAAQRVFGPVRGAGVQITEREAQKSIEPGALGFTGYAGVLEKGPVGELISVGSKEEAAKKIGSYIPDSLLPDAINHYFDLAAGAGGIFLVRVTDGNEQKAETNLYMRRTTQSLLGQLKAKNGGRWGGKKKNHTAEVSVIATDITATTLDTGLATFSTDEWKGGFLELDGVASTRYKIVSNTAAGVITVESDQTLDADLAGGGDPTNKRYYLILENGGKALSYEIRDGDEDPDNEFSLFIYVDGALVNEYPNLSIDPSSNRYWVDIVNNDGNNDEVEASQSFGGSPVASARPAGVYGTSDAFSTTVTANDTMTIDLFEFTINSPGGGDPTFALGTTSDAMLPQVLTCTFTDPTTFDVTSDRFGSIATGQTLGAAVTPNNKWTPPFTVTAGGSPLSASDTVVIVYKPMVPGELAGGFVFPDKPNEKRLRYRIASNTHNKIVAVQGSDLTNGGAITAGAEFMVEATRELEEGRDGNADLVDSDYISQAWDVDNSPFNQTEGKNLGLVKLATPGVTSTAVQKAGVAYADAKNHQYRYEIPNNITTESAAEEYVTETLGRSDYAKVNWPSYAKVTDPLANGENKLKTVSLTGMFHGREARIASDNLGYHKAGAGVDATLPAILELPTGNRILNEEILNPRGINVVRKSRGNFVMWGDRTLWTDPTWKFAHHREQMSYYEHVLQESFDFTIFALNDAGTRGLVRTSLISFFLPEYRKRALDNDLSFQDAAKIKVDKENNTAATKAAGDMIADVELALVDTVERLRIRMSKAGLFTATV